MNGRIQLRRYLKRAEKSQGWLSRELGIAKPTVSMILNGHRQPTLNQAAKIEELTGIPARAFAEAA